MKIIYIFWDFSRWIESSTYRFPNGFLYENYHLNNRASFSRSPVGPSPPPDDAISKEPAGCSAGFVVLVQEEAVTQRGAPVSPSHSERGAPYLNHHLHPFPVPPSRTHPSNRSRNHEPLSFSFPRVHLWGDIHAPHYPASSQISQFFVLPWTQALVICVSVNAGHSYKEPRRRHPRTQAHKYLV